MHSKHIISILASGLFLAACDSTVTNINDEAKEKGDITIKVVDNHSGAALPNVTVYSVIDDETVYSDSLGRSTWKGSTLGDHAFQISKDGYATVQTTVSLVEQGQGNVARVGDVIATVPMYKAGVVAKGYVLYTDDKGKQNAAEGITVYARLPEQFVPSEVSVKTSEDGEYSFKDLPEGVEIALYVGQQTIDSKKYIGGEAKLIGGTSYRAGDLINVSTISLSKLSSSIVKISDNSSELKESSDFTITYAAELEPDSVVSSKWTVTNSSGSTVLTTVSLSNDRRTIRITPYSGKWNDETTYTVRGTVYSTDGGSASVSTSFGVGIKSRDDAPAGVKDLTIEKDPDYTYRVNLTWTAPKESVYRYNIYRMTNLNTDFVYVTYVSGSYTSYVIDLDDFSSSVTEISYIVLPVNSDGVEADINAAKAATYTIK